MKHFYTLITVLILGLSVEGQKGNIFKFKYRIEGNIRIDTANFYVTINLNSDSTVSLWGSIKDTTVRITDGLYVCFEDADNRRFYAFLDSNRDCSVKLHRGIYSMNPIGVGIKPIDTILNLNHSFKTIMRFKVDSTPLPNFFWIRSKRKLSKEELYEIKKCVDQNRGFDNCENKNLYRFMLEI